MLYFIKIVLKFPFVFLITNAILHKIVKKIKISYKPSDAIQYIVV